MSSVPTWVYILFFALVYMGYQRCFTSVVKIKRLIILPVALAWLSLHGLWTSLDLTYHSLWSYALGLIIGLYIGFMQLRDVQVRADKSQQLIEIPGDWRYLIFVLVFFAVEFIINFAIATTSSIAHSGFLIALILFISSILVGIACGRSGCYLLKYWESAHADLPVYTKHSSRAS
ncbi:MAG TPA: DUF6622 family protein [Gammaproteobacteria bacterium]|nr:DUF6622 family protein [Gammaproteobacteria bacterium]